MRVLLFEPGPPPITWQTWILCRLVCVKGLTLKGNVEMFVVCVTDTQPKECKGVVKRLMDVVDHGESFDRLCD